MDFRRCPLLSSAAALDSDLAAAAAAAAAGHVIFHQRVRAEQPTDGALSLDLHVCKMTAGRSPRLQGLKTLDVSRLFSFLFFPFSL